MTNQETILRDHILSRNSVFAGGCFSIVVDPKHWAEYGVFTPEDFDKFMLVETYMDLYKSVYGVKPRYQYASLREASIESLKKDVIALHNQLEYDIIEMNEIRADDAAYEAALNYDFTKEMRDFDNFSYPYENLDDQYVEFEDENSAFWF